MERELIADVNIPDWKLEYFRQIEVNDSLHCELREWVRRCADVEQQNKLLLEKMRKAQEPKSILPAWRSRMFNPTVNIRF
jgi:hypothetical protein